MDYTKVFYWLVVADNARAFFVTFIIIFMLIAVVSTIFYFINSHSDGYGGQSDNDEIRQKMARKWMWWSIPFCMLFWALYIGTPSKKDALLIVAGGQTLNFLANDESAKQIPQEMSSFVLSELRQMAAETKVDLGILNQKDRILEEAKKLTTEELIKKVQTDSIFAKILLKN